MTSEEERKRKQIRAAEREYRRNMSVLTGQGQALREIVKDLPKERARLKRRRK